jgi:hypothetical protein
MKIPLLVAVMLALVLSLPGAQAQFVCPDERASQVDPRVLEANFISCNLGIIIFGIKIGLGGPLCPRKKWTVPAHQECLGEENVGTYCRVQGALPIQFEECDCRTIGEADFGIMLPECVCTVVPNLGGFVEDFETVNCPMGP